MKCLRDYMQKNDVTQAQLGAQLKVSQGAISHWLNGRKSPTLENLLDLSRITGLTLDQLTAELRKKSDTTYSGRRRRIESVQA